MKKGEKQKQSTNDPILLKQKLIFTQSELSRYKAKVKDYQDNYHYLQLDELKDENKTLKEEIKQKDELVLTKTIAMERLNEQLQLALEETSKNREELHSITEENQALTKVVSELKSTVESKESEIDKWKEEVTRLKGTIENREELIKEYESQRSLSKNNNDSWFLRNLKESQAISSKKQEHHQKVDSVFFSQNKTSSSDESDNDFLSIEKKSEKNPSNSSKENN